MLKIAIVDYGAGNILSILAAFEKLGIQAIVTRGHEEIMSSDGLVIPGVGSYSHAMSKLKEYYLDDVIRDYSKLGRPILGICLGMQLLFSGSYEFGYTEGIDLLSGEVRRLELKDRAMQKLPHVSWNGLETSSANNWKNSILDGIKEGEDMYFVHTYQAVPTDNNHILSYTKYSNSKFCSSIRSGNIFGCQFHPEKSGEKGLKIVFNFIRICEDCLDA